MTATEHGDSAGKWRRVHEGYYDPNGVLVDDVDVDGILNALTQEVTALTQRLDEAEKERDAASIALESCAEALGHKADYQGAADWSMVVHWIIEAEQRAEAAREALTAGMRNFDQDGKPLWLHDAVFEAIHALTAPPTQPQPGPR